MLGDVLAEASVPGAHPLVVGECRVFGIKHTEPFGSGRGVCQDKAYAAVVVELRGHLCDIPQIAQCKVAVRSLPLRPDLKGQA